MTKLSKPVRRVSSTRLSAAHGRDKNRRIIITIIPGNGGSVPDLIQLKPERLKCPRSIALEDLYVYLIKCEANQKFMAKLRERKAKKEEQRKAAAWKRELRKPICKNHERN
jgi:hypothetical protein